MNTPRFEHHSPVLILGCPQYANPKEVCPSLAWDRLKALKARHSISSAFGYEVGLEVYPPGFPNEGFRFYYMAGIPVECSLSTIPCGFFAFPLPQSDYAVFEVPSVGALGQTFYEIYHEWLPSSDMVPACPYDLERYHYEPQFRVEVLIPIRRKTTEPDGAANGSQPIRSETNRTSPAVGSRR